MKKRACIVVASEMTVRAFLRHQIAAMQSDYELTVIAGTTNADLLRELGLHGARLVMVDIPRTIAPARDLLALCQLLRIMRGERFDLVHSFTPKAGLLAMGAARLAGIAVRVHTFTGQVWATRSGLSRTMLKSADALTAANATLTLADSPSQLAFLIEQGVVRSGNGHVIGKGSVSGVDAGRFRPDPVARRAVRHRLGMVDSDVVLTFMGRLNRDKGVLDLAKAFAVLASERTDVRLLVVGPDEGGMQPAMRALCGPHAGRVQFEDFTDQPQAFMAASDVLCLPSYREGFGSVVIEAAAAGVPAVASRIYGLTDAVEDGRTGLLHAAGDDTALADALRVIVNDEELRARLGTAAMRRAREEFSQPVVAAALLDVYRHALKGERPASNAAEGERDAGTHGIYRRWGKRGVDVVLSATALLVLSPVLAVVALAVRRQLGAPVLFRQRRPGLGAHPFVMCKFRTMSSDCDADGRSLPDHLRLGALGRFLRASSLDELPELWNVLRGEMSLVGPRPLLMQYLDRYTPQQARRHEVRPGITGLAQVSGRNALAWDDKFALDVTYVDRCSLALDLSILARTVWNVLARRGISAPGQATTTEFMGSAPR